ncbi:phytanoyl-CoA dioxygenase family protein [Flavobacterium sp.]|uniref:phytanoyl-CoA dioxygenase family protein n=1 Tax=Flavobacterium sp. TaxID=239 RepID=UPI003D6A3D85
MPWTILEKLWKHTSDSNQDGGSNDSIWDKEIEMLYRLGISMEETLQYLYFQKPSLEAFKNWVESYQNDTIAEKKLLTDSVLTKEDIEFWNENGYVIVKNAIEKSDCSATVQAIWDFMGMQSEKRETWYKRHEKLRGLMLNFSNHETLNKNRASLRIQKAYEELYGTEKIYKTIDKVSFNPPETANFKFLGSSLHWDVSLKLPIPFRLQGLLYLTDCEAHDGAFHCVPGFHHQIEGWINGLLPEENPREKALQNLKPVPVVGNAGDFIIWHQALPHCASPNHGNSPRMVQYLTYVPENYVASSEWI